MGPPEPRPRLQRRWTTRLDMVAWHYISGQAGGTGDGWAATRKGDPRLNAQGADVTVGYVGRSTVTLPVSRRPTPNPFRAQLRAARPPGPAPRPNARLANVLTR